MNEHKQRFFSGFFLVFILIFLIKFGGLFIFKLALAVVIYLALSEFFKLFEMDHFFRNWGFIFGIILPFCVKGSPPYAMMVIFILLIFSLTVMKKEVKSEILNSLFACSFGIFYIPFLLSFLVSLRLYAGNSNPSENLISLISPS